MSETRGTELHPDDRREVLASYAYRMTTESKRQWPGATRHMVAGGYRMPDRTDAQWLAASYFTTRKDGRLDRRVKHCRTEHTS